MSKKIYKTALAVAVGLASVSAARADSDVLLGFNDAAASSSTAQNDYVIDLGYTGTALVAAANNNGGTVNLSSLLNPTSISTAFSSDTSYKSDVTAGVVEAYSGSRPFTLFQTFANGPAFNPSQGEFANSVSAAQSPTLGVYGSTSTTGWTWFVAASATAGGTETSGTDVADSTGNPMGQISGGTLSMNLYESEQTSSIGAGKTPTAWTDVGTFNINLNNDTLTFVTPVPEPATYGIWAGVGLLALSLGRHFRRKMA